MGMVYFFYQNMSRYKDIMGMKFNRLTVVGITNLRTSSGTALWDCACECGRQVRAEGASLRNGHSKSCGCLKADVVKHNARRHGHASHLNRSGEYRSWMSMKTRCGDTSYHAFGRYGGRGIKVCERWLESFENFIKDMGPRPSGTSIDRFPNNYGNYEPGNCRWATRKEQRANRSDS